VAGRVLRRRTFSSNVLFLDVMVTELDGAPTAGPTVLSCCLSCAPEITKPSPSGAAPRPATFYADKAVFDRVKSDVRPGDAVLARGAFEAESASAGAWTKGLRVADVALLEKWEPHTTGTFHLRASQAKGFCAAPAKPVTAASAALLPGDESRRTTIQCTLATPHTHPARSLPTRSPALTPFQEGNGIFAYAACLSCPQQACPTFAVSLALPLHARFRVWTGPSVSATLHAFGPFSRSLWN